MLGGLVGYYVLRSLLGGEIMLIVALIALAAGAVIVTRNLQTNRKVAGLLSAQVAQITGLS